MLKNLHYILQQICHLDQNRALVVGVSGGPDSLCLLDLLAQSGYPLLIAYFNHGLRAEAVDEARGVEARAARLEIPFVSGGEDVQAYARAKRKSIEEVARELRYQFLFTQAQRINAQAVAVGHTANDQVETVLMHLLRGTGLQGLRGMEFRSLPNPWSNQIALIRPLLGLWRDEIWTYLEEKQLQPVLDESNLDPSYYRNRIRNELIPYLKGYNPAIGESIYRMSSLLRADYKVIESAVRDARMACHFQAGEGYVSMDVALWRSQSISIRRYLLRQAVAELRPGQGDIDYAMIERASRYLDGQGSEALELAAGIQLLIEGDRFWLFTNKECLPTDVWPQIKIDEWAEVTVPGERQLSSGWEFIATEISGSPNVFLEAEQNKDPYQAWIDLDALKLPLKLRGRLPGDRIRLLGMQGHSAKIADLMINLKLPQRVRDGWPLLASGDEIVWVPGLRLAEHIKVRDDTTRVAYLQLRRKNRH